MLNIGGGEFFLLAVLAVFIIGPKNLPAYAAKLGDMVRSMRDMAEGAKTQIKEEMGPSFNDVDWRQLDPRQYDPRRIVREALKTPSKTTAEAAGMVPVDDKDTAAVPSTAKSETKTEPRAAARPNRRRFNPELPTPFDLDAT